MKLASLLFAFLCFAAPAFAQGSYAAAAPITINQYGAPVPNALATLCTSNPGTGTCASLVQTYTDVTLTTACSGSFQPLNNSSNPTVGSGCSNPGYGDALGNIVIYAPPGFYWCQYSGASIKTYSQPCNFPGSALPYLNSADGTVCHGLAKVDQTAGSSTLGRATSTTGGETLVLGVVQSGCGTSGTSAIITGGLMQVIFDTASVTVGDAGGISSTVAAAVSDLGSASPTTTGPIIGTIILSPAGALPSACTVSPGCWIYLNPGDGGGGGGGSANALVNNPGSSTTNTIAPTAAAVTPITPGCNASATGTQPCETVNNSSGAAVLSVQNNGQVAIGNGTTHNLGSNVSTNSDLDGTLTMSSGTNSYTFAGSYSIHPTCIASDETSIAAVKVTYSGTTSVTFTTSGSSDVVDYHCLFRN